MQIPTLNFYMTPNKNTENKDRFLALVSEEKSGWKEKADWRAQNKNWLRNSGLIATKVLRAIREQKITQIELAGRIGFSPQYLGKILKGQENLTLETIDKLEQGLSIKLLLFDTAPASYSTVVEYDRPSPLPMVNLNVSNPMVVSYNAALEEFQQFEENTEQVA
jgi:transcriptional regulator with XRE-family HTH domain